MGVGIADVVEVGGGRVVGVTSWGPGDGVVVMALHGVPSSGLGFAPFAAAADATGTRLIAPDRPGIGRSTRRPGFTLVDVARDLAAVADALGVGRFGVLGWSGGGPYALAAAATIPERLVGVVCAASMPPTDMPGWKRTLEMPDRVGLALSTHGRMLARPVLRLVSRQAARNPAKLVAQFAKSLPPEDRAVLAADPDDTSAAEMLVEAMRGGPDGVLDDYAALRRPWGFRLADVQFPVQVWHGSADRMVAPAVGAHLAGRLPAATLRVLDGRGHLGVVAHAGEALLAASGR